MKKKIVLITIAIIITTIVIIIGIDSNTSPSNEEKQKITLQEAKEKILDTKFITVNEKCPSKELEKIITIKIGTIAGEAAKNILLALSNSKKPDNLIVLNIFKPHKELIFYDNNNEEIAKLEFYGEKHSNLIYSEITFPITDYDGSIINEIISKLKN